jgi:hypothetical protein
MGPVEQQVSELLRGAEDAAKLASSDAVNRGRTAGGLDATIETLHGNVVALTELVGGLIQICAVLAREIDESRPTKPIGDDAN